MIYVPFHLNVGAEYLPLSYDARMMLEETVNRKSDAEKRAFYACDIRLSTFRIDSPKIYPIFTLNQLIPLVHKELGSAAKSGRFMTKTGRLPRPSLDTDERLLPFGKGKLRE